MNIQRILEIFPRPFSYDKEEQVIRDAHGYGLIDIHGWDFLFGIPNADQIQDDLGEWIVKLLNDGNLT